MHTDTNSNRLIRTMAQDMLGILTMVILTMVILTMVILTMAQDMLPLDETSKALVEVSETVGGAL